MYRLWRSESHADVGNNKAGMQATAFMNNAGNRVASESKGFVQGFSLPGEAEKSAKILQSFLGACNDLSWKA